MVPEGDGVVERWWIWQEGAGWRVKRKARDAVSGERG
jgi:hypothetical protein